MKSENLESNNKQQEVEQQLRSQIEEGLKALRKQCKQLSKNELITALLQQVEALAQQQALNRQIYEELQLLKNNSQGLQERVAGRKYEMEIRDEEEIKAAQLCEKQTLKKKDEVK